MARGKLCLSPSTVIAVIALIAALSGTAYAAGAFTKKQKKQVTTLATKVFDSRIGAASVKHAGSAGSAPRAETVARADLAAKALEATTAGKAVEVPRAREAATAQKATEAITAQRVREAGTAANADSVPLVPAATSAANAETLGGSSPATFQRSLADNCPPRSTIGSFTPEGAVQCTSPVRTFQINPPAGTETTLDFGDGLVGFVSCIREEPGAFVSFIRWANSGGTAGTMNLFAFRGQAGVVGDFSLSNPQARVQEGFSPRLEGQYIWKTPQAVTTIMIHAFDGNGFCELGGTVVTALG